MTEEVAVSGIEQDNSTPSAIVSAPSDGSAQATSPAEASTNKSEPVTPNKYVTDIVRRERADAYEKGKREALAELQKTTQPSEGTQGANATSMGGMPSVSDDKIRALIAEHHQALETTRTQEQEQQRLYTAAAGIAQDFKSALAEGKNDYSDFDDVIKDVNFGSISEIVQMVHETDKGLMQHAMYDLAKNGQKITNLMILAHTQPGIARREVKNWLDSIRSNREAQGHKQPNAPLTNVTPSTVGTADGSGDTVKSYKRAAWARA